MTEQPLTQAQDHDRRIGRLEGIAEQLDHRLDSIDRTMAAGFAALRNEMQNQFAALRNENTTLHRRLDTQFRWIVGIQITTLIAIGSLLFSLLSKLP